MPSFTCRFLRKRIGDFAQLQMPFALSAACDSKRTRGVATDGHGAEERGSRSECRIQPFDFGLLAYAQGNGERVAEQVANQERLSPTGNVAGGASKEKIDCDALRRASV
jgi:hypothetical protein